MQTIFVGSVFVSYGVTMFNWVLNVLYKIAGFADLFEPNITVNAINPIFARIKMRETKKQTEHTTDHFTVRVNEIGFWHIQIGCHAFCRAPFSIQYRDSKTKARTVVKYVEASESARQIQNTKIT